MPERDVAAVFALPSGQQRVNELFGRAADEGEPHRGGAAG